MNAMVKSLYHGVNTLRQCDPCHLWHPAHQPSPLNNITVTRRRNALALFQSYAEEALASGTPPKGLEQSFAQKLEISPSMWSQVKSSRPIGDKMARQIEQHCGKPSGWLDEERESAGLTPAEQQFLAIALQAWRATNASGRKQLRAYLKDRCLLRGQ